MEKLTKDPRAALVARLKHCRHLPTLPAIAVQLVDLANDASASLAQFTELIERDPALASKLLRVANSSFYGRRRAVPNLPQALSLLGLNATVTLALSFSLRGALSEQHAGRFDVASYWRRSLLTALASRTIAVELDESHPEDFFLAGLLHDIGVLVMGAMLGDTYAGLCATSTSHEDLLAREAAAFDFNHAEAGTYLLREWQLPDDIADSALLSHETAAFPERVAEVEQLPTCVAVAMGIVDAWCQGATPAMLAVAHEPARARLGLDAEQYHRIITTMGQLIPDLERLFETDLADPCLIQNAEDSAQEILLTRSLQTLQSAAALDRHIQALEDRTAVLEDQARRDAMTGLFSRSYLERVLEHEFDRANREGHPISLAFVDVDRFKVINDTLGHAAGDQVLIAVARRMLCEVRQTDFVARYGGEEFVILLVETRSADAMAVMERVLSSVRDTPFVAADRRAVNITVSVGLATHMEEGRAFQSVAALLGAADSTLYRAKDAGRARVIVHQTSSDVV